MVAAGRQKQTRHSAMVTACAQTFVQIDVTLASAHQIHAKQLSIGQTEDNHIVADGQVRDVFVQSDMMRQMKLAFWTDADRHVGKKKTYLASILCFLKMGAKSISVTIFSCQSKV